MIDYFLLSSPVFSLVKLFDVLDFNPLFSDVHCGLCFNLYASVNNFTTHSLIIVISRLRMPNGFTTMKSCVSIQWVVTSKSLTNYNHYCLTWTNKVKAIVLTDTDFSPSVLFVGSNICADPAQFKSGISSQSLSSKSISISINFLNCLPTLSINFMHFLNCLPTLSVSCLVYLGHVWRMWRVLSGGSNHYVSFAVTTLSRVATGTYLRLFSREYHFLIGQCCREA